MGQEDSKLQNSQTSVDKKTIKRLSAQCLNRFEANSLNSHLEAIRKGEVSLTELLGIEKHPGASLLLRIADNLAFGNLESNTSIAVAWFNKKLPNLLNIDDLHWQKQIFDAASITNMGSEHFMTYSDFRDFVWVLFSAFDWDYCNFNTNHIEPLDLTAIQQITDDYKTPAIRFEQFNSFFAIYPHALTILGNIWNRMLVDKHTTDYEDQKCSKLSLAALNPLRRRDKAIIYGIFGPQMGSASIIFDIHEHGRSWSSFVTKVSQIPDSTIIFAEGWADKTLRSTPNNKKDTLEHKLPSRDDTDRTYTGSVRVIFFILESWKKKYTTYTSKGQCFVLVLEPTVLLYSLEQAYFDSVSGFSVGLSTSFSPVPQNKTDTCFRFDIDFQNAVFQCTKGAVFNYRFDLENLMVWRRSNST